MLTGGQAHSNQRSRGPESLFVSMVNRRCWDTKVVSRRLERRYRLSHLTDDYRAWCVQFEHQRIVFQLEYASHGSRTIDCCPDSKSLWQKIDSLLHPVSSTSVLHSTDDFNHNFTSKFEAIRVTTASSPPPTINCRDVPPFPGFTSMTAEEVSQLYAIPQRNSVNSTRYQRGWSRSCVMQSQKLSQPMHRLTYAVSYTQ